MPPSPRLLLTCLATLLAMLLLSATTAPWQRAGDAPAEAELLRALTARVAQCPELAPAVAERLEARYGVLLRADVGPLLDAGAACVKAVQALPAGLRQRSALGTLQAAVASATVQPTTQRALRVQAEAAAQQQRAPALRLSTRLEGAATR